ncbi:hypothetical protein [Nocardia sp. NPDC060249]|uniref:hypothetical protein n=1 Tax=Nocardia sp. NPDC060249 TaxID=3347082 RepID=UPI00365D0716
MWLDADGRNLAIGDPVTLVGAIAGRAHLGRGKHGAVAGFGRKYVQVVIDSGAHYMAGEQVTVEPGDLLYGHSGYQNHSDKIRVIEDDLAGDRIDELLQLGCNCGVITADQAEQLVQLWKETRFPPKPNAESA